MATPKKKSDVVRTFGLDPGVATTDQVNKLVKDTLDKLQAEIKAVDKKFSNVANELRAEIPDTSDLVNEDNLRRLLARDVIVQAGLDDGVSALIKDGGDAADAVIEVIQGSIEDGDLTETVRSVVESAIQDTKTDLHKAVVEAVAEGKIEAVIESDAFKDAIAEHVDELASDGSLNDAIDERIDERIDAKLEDALDDYVSSDALDDFVTEDQLSKYVTESQLTKELANYVTDEQLDERIESFVTKDELNEAVDKLVDLDSKVQSTVSNIVTSELTKADVLKRLASLESELSRVRAVAQEVAPKAVESTSDLRSDVKDAGYRIAAKQITKTVHAPLVAAFCTASPEHASMIELFFRSDLGKAAMGASLSIGAALVGDKLEDSHAEVADRLSRELRVGAMAEAADFASDLLLGPLRASICAALSNPGIEKVRVVTEAVETEEAELAFTHQMAQAAR